MRTKGNDSTIFNEYRRVSIEIFAQIRFATISKKKTKKIYHFLISKNSSHQREFHFNLENF